MTLIAIISLLILTLKMDFISPLWKQWVVWIGGWHNAIETLQTVIGSLYLWFMLFSTAPMRRKIGLTLGIGVLLTINCCDWQELMVGIGFFALGWLMRRQGFYLWVVILAGVIPELTQLLWHGRIFDVRDVVCNSSMILLGYWMKGKKGGINGLPN